MRNQLIAASVLVASSLALYGCNPKDDGEPDATVDASVDLGNEVGPADGGNMDGGAEDASTGDMDATAADAAPDASADMTEDADASPSGSLCDPACGPGQICVYPNASSTELECVDGFAGAWDDGTNPARALDFHAQTGWLRKRADDWEAKNLRCNDGTPYGYYINPGVGAEANNWLIFFRGGNACTDAEGCATRWATNKIFMRQWKSVVPGYNPSYDGEAGMYLTGAQAGRYSRSEPTNLFRDWTWVHLHYCSSDVYTGTRLGTDDPSGFWFRGHAITMAVIEELLDGVDASSVGVDVPSLSDAAQVVVGGGSAGSVGARHNMDRIASMIAERNAATSVKGLLDAAIDVPVLPRTPPRDGVPTPNELWGAEGNVDQDCLEAHVDNPILCTSAPHALNGDGGASLLGLADGGHLGVPGMNELKGVEGVFTYMAELDALARTTNGVAGLCVPSECSTDADCGGPADVCMSGVCLTVQPCTPSYCIQSPCHPAGEATCLGMVATHTSACSVDADCAAGFCDSGFCVERRVTPCSGANDCPTGYLCGGIGRCSKPASGPSDCSLPGYQFEVDTQTCEQVADCSGVGSVPCGPGYFCMPAEATPNAQTMAWGIRSELSGLGPKHGAFVTNSSHHTITSTGRYYNQRIRGVSIAQAISAWHAGNPAYEELIAPADPFPAAPRAWAVRGLQADGLSARTTGSGCSNDALLIRVCELGSACAQGDALYTLGIGDSGTASLAGAAVAPASPLKLVVDRNPGCTAAQITIPDYSWITLSYQFGPGATQVHDLRVALPASGAQPPTLPLTLYLGAGGSTFFDGAYQNLAARRLD